MVIALLFSCTLFQCLQVPENGLFHRLELDSFLKALHSPCADLLTDGSDVSGFCQRPARQYGTDELIDEYAEKDRIADKKTGLRPESGCGCTHTERYACLREQRYAEVLRYLRRAIRLFAADKRAKIFAETAKNDIYGSYEQSRGLFHDTELKIGAA